MRYNNEVAPEEELRWVERLGKSICPLKISADKDNPKTSMFEFMPNIMYLVRKMLVTRCDPRILAYGNGSFVIHSQAKAALQKEAKVGTKVTNERHLAGSLRSRSVLSFCRRQSNNLEMLGGIGDNASEQVDHISIRGVRVNF